MSLQINVKPIPPNDDFTSRMSGKLPGRAGGRVGGRRGVAEVTNHVSIQRPRRRPAPTTPDDEGS